MGVERIGDRIDGDRTAQGEVFGSGDAYGDRDQQRRRISHHLQRGAGRVDLRIVDVRIQRVLDQVVAERRTDRGPLPGAGDTAGNRDDARPIRRGQADRAGRGDGRVVADVGVDRVGDHVDRDRPGTRELAGAGYRRDAYRDRGDRGHVVGIQGQCSARYKIDVVHVRGDVVVDLVIGDGRSKRLLLRCADGAADRQDAGIVAGLNQRAERAGIVGRLYDSRILDPGLGIVADDVHRQRAGAAHAFPPRADPDRGRDRDDPRIHARILVGRGDLQRAVGHGDRRILDIGSRDVGVEIRAHHIDGDSHTDAVLATVSHRPADRPDLALVFGVDRGTGGQRGRCAGEVGFDRVRHDVDRNGTSHRNAFFQRRAGAGRRQRTDAARAFGQQRQRSGADARSADNGFGVVVDHVGADRARQASGFLLALQRDGHRPGQGPDGRVVGAGQIQSRGGGNDARVVDVGVRFLVRDIDGHVAGVAHADLQVVVLASLAQHLLRLERGVLDPLVIHDLFFTGRGARDCRRHRDGPEGAGRFGVHENRACGRDASATRAGSGVQRCADERLRVAGDDVHGDRGADADVRPRDHSAGDADAGEIVGGRDLDRAGTVDDGPRFDVGLRGVDVHADHESPGHGEAARLAAGLGQGEVEDIGGRGDRKPGAHETVTVPGRLGRQKRDRRARRCIGLRSGQLDPVGILRVGDDVVGLSVGEIADRCAGWIALIDQRCSRGKVERFLGQCDPPLAIDDTGGGGVETPGPAGMNVRAVFDDSFCGVAEDLDQERGPDAALAALSAERIDELLQALARVFLVEQRNHRVHKQFVDSETQAAYARNPDQVHADGCVHVHNLLSAAEPQIVLLVDPRAALDPRLGVVVIQIDRERASPGDLALGGGCHDPRVEEIRGVPQRPVVEVRNARRPRLLQVVCRVDSRPRIVDQKRIVDAGIDRHRAARIEPRPTFDGGLRGVPEHAQTDSHRDRRLGALGLGRA